MSIFTLMFGLFEGEGHIIFSFFVSSVPGTLACGVDLVHQQQGLFRLYKSYREVLSFKYHDVLWNAN